MNIIHQTTSDLAPDFSVEPPDYPYFYAIGVEETCRQVAELCEAELAWIGSKLPTQPPVVRAMVSRLAVVLAITQAPWEEDARQQLAAEQAEDAILQQQEIAWHAARRAQQAAQQAAQEAA